MANGVELALSAQTSKERLLEMTDPVAVPDLIKGSAIDVCVCTFRRASLAATLESIRMQTGEIGRVRVIVADNDDTPSARSLVDIARMRGMDIHYVHAPARNISIARNACLSVTEAHLVAFIDDDEVADPRWLQELSGVLLADPGLTAVFGPVRALYPSNAPSWAVEADLHSVVPVVTARGVDTGYTSNAMVLGSALAGQRFDVALGRSGGEDTDLFTRLYRQGARYGVASSALVFEEVAQNRLSTEWLATRAFRAGQTHARRFMSGTGMRLRAGAVASAKCLYCLALTLFNAGSASRWRRSWIRASLHAGAVGRLCGLREGRLYG